MLVSFKEHLNEQKLPKLLVDMDGVLADFDRSVIELTGKHPDIAFKDKKTKEELKIKLFNDNFFEKLKPMRDMKVLWDYIKKYNPEILTATGKFNSKEVAKEKAVWIKKYLGNPKFNYVTRSHEKAKFANPNTLLIDDREKSTKPFKQAGGQVILHTSAIKTIKELKALGY